MGGTTELRVPGACRGSLRDQRIGTVPDLTYIATINRPMLVNNQTQSYNPPRGERFLCAVDRRGASNGSTQYTRYRQYRAPTDLDRIEAAELAGADQERIETVRTLLQDVSRSHPDHREDVDNEFSTVAVGEADQVLSQFLPVFVARVRQ